MSAELRRLAEAVELETSGDWYRVDDTARIFTKNPEDVAYIAAADPQTILALLDRAEAAEAKVARVEALMRGDYASNKHVSGWSVVRVADLRAALAPAPTEAANGRQIGSDERVEAYDGAAADRRSLHDPDSGRIDNWSER